MEIQIMKSILNKQNGSHKELLHFNKQLISLLCWLELQRRLKIILYPVNNWGWHGGNGQQRGITIREIDKNKTGKTKVEIRFVKYEIVFQTSETLNAMTPSICTLRTLSLFWSHLFASDTQGSLAKKLMPCLLESGIAVFQFHVEHVAQLQTSSFYVVASTAMSASATILACVLFKPLVSATDARIWICVIAFWFHGSTLWPDEQIKTENVNIKLNESLAQRYLVDGMVVPVVKSCLEIQQSTCNTLSVRVWNWIVKLTDEKQWES